MIATLLLASLLADAPAGAKADRPVAVGTRLELFCDGGLIESSAGISLKLHPPQRREVVFTFDAPWEGPQSAYVTVFKDGERFRMYYRGGGDLTEEYACLAESKDGIRWTRPELGLFPCKGSDKTNIIYKPKEKSYREAHNFAPFKDTNPAALPEQRYKAVGLGRIYDEEGNGYRTLNALVSPDGIHWKKLREQAVMTDGSFDSLNTNFWDGNLRKYVCYLRAGRDGKRQIQRSVSDDFVNWSRPQWLEYGDGPMEQFYTNGITPYPRALHLYIGLPMRFVPERKKIGLAGREIDGLSDAVFMSSRDGINFNRPFMEAYIRPGLDPDNWGNAHGNQTPAAGILQTGAGEISVYWLEGYGSRAPRLIRGTVRLDGFASLNAGFKGGECVTKPLTFEGGRLVLNFATSAVGSVKVEIQDAAGRAIPGFDLSSCDEIYGDELGRPVSFRGKTDLGGLAGKPVRVRFVLRDADVFSMRFAREDRR